MTTHNETAATAPTIPGKHTILSTSKVARLLGLHSRAFVRRYGDVIPFLPHRGRGRRRYRWGDVVKFFEAATATPADAQGNRPRLVHRPKRADGHCRLEDCRDL